MTSFVLLGGNIAQFILMEKPAGLSLNVMAAATFLAGETAVPLEGAAVMIFLEGFPHTDAFSSFFGGGVLPDEEGVLSSVLLCGTLPDAAVLLLVAGLEVVESPTFGLPLPNTA